MACTAASRVGPRLVVALELASRLEATPESSPAPESADKTDRAIGILHMYVERPQYIARPVLRIAACMCVSSVLGNMGHRTRRVLSCAIVQGGVF